MRLITIVNKGWGSLEIKEGKVKGARLEWRAKNMLEVYIKGPATDCYDLMAVKAVEKILEMGGKAIDLRKVSCGCVQKIERQKERLL